VNKTCTRTHVVGAILIFLAAPLLAQKTGPEFSGYIDASYNYNFSKGTTNSLRSYDARANQILLNNVHLAASGTPSSKLSYVAEFDFGTDAGVHGLLNQVTPGAGAVGVALE
jgi:hypothetical protein